MSEITPNPDAIPDVPTDPSTNGFDFSSLNPNVEPSMEPPTFEAPRKPRWWESKKKTEQRASKPKKAMPTAPRGGLRKPLEEMYAGLGMMILPFDPGCGKVIIEAAPKCAESLDELSRTNPALRRILIGLVTTSALGAVFMAHAPIVAAVMMHHVPALRERQEKMVGEFAEMMANGFNMPTGDDASDE